MGSLMWGLPLGLLVRVMPPGLANVAVPSGSSFIAQFSA